MIQRAGEVITRMPADVTRKAIGPSIERAIAPGAVAYTDGYDICARLTRRGHAHRAACHAAGEPARDDDGDGFRGVHVNTPEGPRSLLRSWPRPHRGASQGRLPLYRGSFELVHNVRRRGEALPGSLIELLVAPRNPG